MTIGSFIFKNALRNKRRTFLSILSVAVSLFLLMILLVALHVGLVATLGCALVVYALGAWAWRQ